MDGARSIASVLHGRLQRLQPQSQGHGVTWAQRTPQNAPDLAHELAAGLDDRRRELSERALANPEPWLTRHLGPPPGPDASPVLREDYARRAGTAAAYREAGGITDPDQAVSFSPHPGPELEILRKDTLRALEIADENAEIRAMSRGQLEAQVLAADRTQATAPPDTSSLLRLRRAASKLLTRSTRHGPPGPPAPGRQPGRPRPSCSAAGSTCPPGEHRDRRAWPPGGGNSRRTPTPWTARSSASTRPPSATASRGHRSASRSRAPGTGCRRNRARTAARAVPARNTRCLDGARAVGIQPGNSGVRGCRTCPRQ
jgi:hypothetical protein